jgi:hypothetical protein
MLVELNLTPIQGHHDWDTRVACGVIRRHGTAPDEKDLFVDELPDDVYWNMVANIGLEKADWLLNHDFLPEIDWDLYEKHNNGGCAFDKCSSKG